MRLKCLRASLRVAMRVESKSFPEKAAEALKDQVLQNALKHIKDGFVEARRKALDELPDFGDLRREAQQIRDEALDHLPDYLELFEKNVEEQGGCVHWARNAAEACEIVGEICRAVDARSIAKSKSMVSEEIELTLYLEDDGFQVTETDLGEYIIQLRHERPSHIIAPVIHLSKDQIADTFHDEHAKYGFSQRLDERSELVQEARSVLRRRFLEADVGITGANFLIAETGSVVVVTNEGNADLCVTLPETHIVVTGIEKVVSTLDDCQKLLRLLVRSATGQPTTSYVSFFTGAPRADDVSGPKNFHVVLVDNGRSEMFGTDFQDILRCIRCGACLNHCPVYANVGGHAYGSVYTGPMGAVLTPSLAGIDKAAHLPNASTFCGRCEAVCPVAIPLPKMLRHWREREFETRLGAPAARWGIGAWSIIAEHPILYRLVLRFSGWVLRRAARKGWIRSVLFAGRGWTGGRDLRVPDEIPFQDQWKRGRK